MQIQLNLVRSLHPISENKQHELVEFAKQNSKFCLHHRDDEKPRGLYYFKSNFFNGKQIPIITRTEWMKVALSISPYPTIRDFADWIFKEAQLISWKMPIPCKNFETVNIIEEHWKRCK